MPVVVAAAAAVFSAVATAATAAGVAVMTSVGLGSLAGVTIAGVQVATVVGALQLGSMAMSLYSMAKKPKAGGGGSPLAFKADPNAYIPFVAGGPVGVGGNQVFAQTAGSKNRWLQYTTVLSHGGPVASATPFKANDEVVPFTLYDGQGASGRYQNRLWQKIALGVVGAAAATVITASGTKYPPGPNGGNPPEWTPAHKLSGMAHSVMSMWADPEKIPQIPKPLWEVTGGPVYDPRKDGTQPGGVGPQRWNDRSTWTTAGNTNPYLQALTFCIGHWYNGIRVGGVGIPLSGIDVPAFVNGANVADANGWKIAWQWHTGMRKWDVFATMLQAGAGIPLVRGSQVSCMVDTPRVSIGTITNADLIGAFSITGCASIRDRKNAIIPRCKSPDHKWTVQPFGRVQAASYLAEDRGEDRPVEVEYESVANGQQVRQLAALELANLREGLGGTVVVPARFLKYRAGDCLTVAASNTLMTGQKVVVVARSFDMKTRTVTLTLRSETDGKHAWALGQTNDAPPSPTLVGADPTVIQPPTPGAWTAGPGTAPGGGTGSGGGTQPDMPVIVVRPTTPTEPDGTGGGGTIADEPAATHVLVRYRRVGVDPATLLPFPWTQDEFPARSDRLELTGLAPGTSYQVEVAYRVRGIASGFTPYGIVTTGALLATDTQSVAGRPAQDVLDDLASVPGQIADAVAALDATVSDALAQYGAQLDAVSTIVSDPTTGLVTKVGTLQTASAAQGVRISQLETQVQTPGTGLLARAAALELTTTNLSTSKADATRVTTLEASVRANAAQTMPTDFQNDGATWSQSWSGAPGALAPITAGAVYSFPTVASIGKVLQVATGGATRDAAPMGARPIQPGKRYRFSARIRVVGPVAGTPQVQLYAIGLDSAYTAVTTPSPPNFTLAADTWTVVSYEITTAELLAFNANVAMVRPMVRMLGASGANTFQIQTMAVEDVTDVTSLSARTGVLETTTANLQTGKADASRVTTLEARADTTDVRLRPNANLLPNPTGADGINRWTPSGSGGWVGALDGSRGYAFKRDFANANGLTATIYSDNFPATAGETYTLAGRANIIGRTAGSSFVQVDFLNAGGGIVAGGSFARGFAVGETDMATNPLTMVAPAGTTQTRVSYQLGGVSGAATASAAFSRFKLERGSVASPFSDEATQANEITARRSVSAAVSVLETTTANLQTGKADASRVALLEARSAGANILTKAQFFGTETNILPYGYYGTHASFNFQIRLADVGYGVQGEGALQLQQNARIGGDPYANFNQFSLGIRGLEAGKRYCFSAYTASLRALNMVAGYFTDVAGNPIAGSDFVQNADSQNNGEKAGSSPSNINTLKRVFIFGTAPANAAGAVVVMRKYDTGTGYTDSYAMFSRLMFSEVTTTATQPPPWSPAAVEARVTTQEVASADLYGRTQARWAIGTAVPGADAFIEARAETTPGSPATSSVAIGARQVAIYNQTNGVWSKALDVQGGNVVLTGGLQAGAFIRLGNGSGWPVALKAVDFSAGDGEVVSFGTDLGSLPVLTFAMNNLLPLNAGESYDVRATGLSATGFTMRAKINVPGTPTAYNRTASVSDNTIAPGALRISKLGDPDSSDGTYGISAAGYNHHAFFGSGSPGGPPQAGADDFASGTLSLWVQKGGVWSKVGTLYVGSNIDTSQYQNNQYFNVAAAWTLNEVVQLGDSVQQVALSYDAPDAYAYLSQFSSLSWTAPGSASSVRSALASGSKTRVNVRPQ